MPAIAAAYHVPPAPEKPLLLGYSKSGWGACSLLLRYPHLFGKAAAWDAPLMLAAPDRWGMDEVFSTAENFAHYRISTLLQQRARAFTGPPRLYLSGYGFFRDHLLQAHDLMDHLHITHAFHDGPERAHEWHSGWLPDAVAWLSEP